MRIGYPCINRKIGCTPNSTFRLINYSDELCVEKTRSNLACLIEVLKFNVDNGLHYFRISSDLVPFASHPICKVKWWRSLKKEFNKIGRFISDNSIRVTMHPDQFVLINSSRKDVVEKSIAELLYHARVLDLMQTEISSKIQIHVGGVYGDKPSAIEKFLTEFEKLPKEVTSRLAVENDDRLYSLSDCVFINRQCGVPIVFDVFHHACLSNGEDVRFAMEEALRTWRKDDGALMVDFSTQKRGARKGAHAEHLNVKMLEKFFKTVKGLNFDLMLEVKDKEQSAIEALKLARKMKIIKR